MNHEHHMHMPSEHGGHGGGDMDMGSKCAMNMIWNTQIIDTCIVFPQWHITSNTSFVFSFFAIVALGVAYEWLRDFQKRVDIRVAGDLRVRLPNEAAVSAASTSRVPSEEDSLLTDQFKGRKIVAVPPLARTYRAVLYGATVFLSFFLMLVFMTYNAYLILAVVMGAALGHFIFGGEIDPNAVLSGAAGGKGMACH
ncbi:Ctr-domain-containing protein [Ramaria rubella]|nr:Ctr-domain-containing protein [Ramaria rubella]